MEKIAIVTDSTADMSQETIEKYDVKVLRLKVIYKDKEFIDGETISADEVYKSLEHEVPKTATPQSGDADALFTQLEAEGYTHVIGIHISSGLSGTLNMVNLAMQSHPKLKACIFDSKALSLGMGELVQGCGEMIKAGKSFDEIVAQLPDMRDKITIYFVVDTLKYLIKGGRIGKVSGVLGSVLHVKPIIKIGKDGVYYTYDKVRGRKQSLKKMLEIVEDALKTTKARVWVMQGDALAEAKEMIEKLKSFKNITKLELGSIGPVLGVHAGPGLIGIGIVKEPFYTL